MASLVGCASKFGIGPTLIPTQFKLSHSTVFIPTPRKVLVLKRIRASSSTAFVETKSQPSETVVEKTDVDSTRNNLLACPVCYDRVTLTDGTGLSVDSTSGASLQCGTCKKTYFGNETHLELIVSSGAKEYGESMAISTEMFRLPLISYLYERGWRQSFSVWGGFPGPENEFELIKGYLKPVLGGNIIDASCGSGMFARLFAKSGLFSQVVALDYSENMLKQCYQFIKQEEGFPKENLMLVRADISRLPFPSSSIDAVHAGAAIHCWPSPSAAGYLRKIEQAIHVFFAEMGDMEVAEISRVLRPGGVFVATTYILDGPYSFIPFLRPLRRSIIQVSGGNIFLSERELEDLCGACGLVGFKFERNRRFVMISATKPT